MFYHICYLSFYKDRKSLYLNECFLYNKNSEVFYYYRKKIIEIIWNITGYNNN